jgi:dTDP-4-amino-4,6-dideoxygalactose transaminase
MKTIAFGKPILGDEERRAVDEVLRGTTLVHGPKAKDFEKEFCAFTGAPHAVSVSSCTAGLHLAYLYLGLKAGDEVIVPAQTHTATAHAVEFCGAKPIFVDAEIQTGNLDIEQVEGLITPRTRALSLVHYLGLPVDMDRIRRLAERHHLFVVEDCALALGARFRGTHTGLFGDLGVFSFYPAKHMTTSEGGMVITRSAEIAARIGRQKAFGVDLDVSERKQPGIYDVTMLGYNYRMSEVAAALGSAQLRRVEGFLASRRRNYQALESGLRGIDELTLFRSTSGPFESSYYCLSALLSDRLAPRRAEIVGHLKENGIGTSVYYPRPVPHLSYYRGKYGFSDDTFPVAARISRSSIALPVGPHLDETDMSTIVNGLKNAIRKVSP